MRRFKRFLLLFKKAYTVWRDSDPKTLGAALAYYTLFSIVPLTILVTFIVGSFFGSQLIEDKLINEIDQTVGRAAADVVTLMVTRAHVTPASLTTAIISIIMIVLGALGAFGQLRVSLHKLWNVPIKKRRGFVAFLEDKVAALLVMLCLAVVIIVSLGVASFSSFIELRYADVPFIGLTEWFAAGISFLLVVVLFVYIYKYLPETNISWPATILGALVTGALFSAGRALIAWYLQLEFVHTTTYGAAGAIIAILVWVFFSSLVVFYGAAFTYCVDKQKELITVW